MKQTSILLALLVSLALCETNFAQSGPSVEQALSFKPIQIGTFDYAQPSDADAASCRLEQLTGTISGWKLLDKNGQTLRIFADTNNDKALDQWRYFKDGVEVYRDIDTNSDNKPDEFRWFNMAGSRWGIDANEDQRIETWKRISAEECVAEIFFAVKTGDKARFEAVLLTDSEITKLDITDAQKKQLSSLIAKAKENFDAAVANKTFPRNADFLQFNGDKPSAVPSESGDGIIAFENVSCFARADGKDFQLSNGTLIQIGNTWKTVFCPISQSNGEHAIVSIFLPGGAASVTSENNLSADKQQEFISSIEKLDSQLAQTTDKTQRTTLHKQRAAIVEKMAKAATGEERSIWYRQLADGLSMGTQMGELPDGTEILSKFALKFKDEDDTNLAAYFTFRELMAKYYVGMSAANADWAEITTEWYNSLEKFVKDFPESPDCAEALFQLASAREMNGREQDALKWYQQIVSNFPNSSQAPKARGAIFRLTCIGKTIPLKGVTADNKALDLEKFKKFNVIVYYWRTDTSTALADTAILKKIKDKYKTDIQIIGVNLDNNPAVLKQFIEDNGIKWFQIEGKGPDGPLACDMGIVNVPTVLLINKDNKVVNRNVQFKDLDSAVKLLVNPPKM